MKISRVILHHLSYTHIRSHSGIGSTIYMNSMSKYLHREKNRDLFFSYRLLERMTKSPICFLVTIMGQQHLSALVSNIMIAYKKTSSTNKICFAINLFYKLFSAKWSPMFLSSNYRLKNYSHHHTLKQFLIIINGKGDMQVIMTSFVLTSIA